jgi:prepilin-type processing-associated H-X9-DG protein/prepilin-type N-terminal cleavage/methylation domain-containing protein
MRAPKSRQVRSQTCAFTLVEVLVVLSIIAALIAILLPAVTAARRSAALVACASNQRQIVQTSLLIAHSHQGYVQLAGELQWYPPVYQDAPPALGDPLRRRYTYYGGTGNPVLGFQDSYAYYWGAVDYVIRGNVIYPMFYIYGGRPHPAYWTFRCPASHEFRWGGEFYGKETTGPGRYGWIGTAGYFPDYIINEGFTGFAVDPPDNVRRLRGQLSKVRSTSNMVLIADGQPRPFPDNWMLWTPTDPVGTVTLGDAWRDRTRSETRTASKDNFDPYRHKGRMNVAFLDGHVETLQMTAADLDRAVLIK